MKTQTTLLTISALLYTTPATAISLHKRQNGEAPKVVGLDLHRTIPASSPQARDRIRRRGTVEAGLDNYSTLYFVNGSIGTPAQEFRFHIDTGSSDLWVNTPSSDLCSDPIDPCAFAGTYSANSSSTYSYIGSYFNISYVDGSGAAGDYVTDAFSIGDASLDVLQFGIGYDSSSAQGILGIGYPANEVQVGRAGLSPYANLPAQMVSEGLITSNAYSLWLNDIDALTGNILFGGVDTERFEGNLATLPIQMNRDRYAEFLVTLTSITVGGNVLANDQALAVLLDSGSSLTYLPDSWVNTIFNNVSASYDSEEGAAFVPCSLADSEDDIVYSFSGVDIRVTMRELVIEIITSDGRSPVFSNGVPACLFGIAPAGTGTNVLGDTFLRSAYVVYDIDNNEVSLAQTRFNAASSNVLEIGTGEDAVPSATEVAGAVAATAGLAESGGNNAIGNADNGAGAFGGSKMSSLAAVVAFSAGVVMFGV